MLTDSEIMRVWKSVWPTYDVTTLDPDTQKVIVEVVSNEVSQSMGCILNKKTEIIKMANEDVKLELDGLNNYAITLLKMLFPVNPNNYPLLYRPDVNFNRARRIDEHVMRRNIYFKHFVQIMNMTWSYRAPFRNATHEVREWRKLVSEMSKIDLGLRLVQFDRGDIEDTNEILKDGVIEAHTKFGDLLKNQPCEFDDFVTRTYEDTVNITNLRLLTAKYLKVFVSEQETAYDAATAQHESLLKVVHSVRDLTDLDKLGRIVLLELDNLEANKENQRPERG
ncbi:Protein CBG25741 [Caenorhabditis briggsae]|uniref:Uncharacterized protein n=2 Tax=Caenorhabditis briggsae TaxID=6238 RepID=A0AAE9A268_CAEBR|nr:Protein CBG25741 [Caenorhabditis briggsae]ULT85114.1 hypothetical protein L3Y34_013668 [Caenorhabditis briggsae]UMM44332.1 hypothetical protein L5515_019495 [Caenorhabditis briggsae]CAR99442.1 Protein CBG25741 [Caenorhabditis briggsae]